jgi:tRNA U55 pseudouridine synthase TruB
MTINGIFAVFKQVGPSSSTIVQSVRRVVGGRAWKHVKIGHGGTLGMIPWPVAFLCSESAKQQSY